MTVAKVKEEEGIMKYLLKLGGGALGGLVGGPSGAALGSSVGAHVSKILGCGDYKVEENSIMSGQVPQFRNGGRSVRISHRDYLGDITGSINFTIQSFPINPGLSRTFPWLSLPAGCYQSYKIKGMVFEFKSTSASALNSVNTALGTVIMATQYNSQLASFTNKLEMENYEFSTSCRPFDNMIHPIECAPGEAPLECLYVRTGSVPSGQDERFYDFGDFQIATVGMQAAATIGELWVSYDIELFKPRIQPGGATPGQYYRLDNGPFDATNFLGAIQTTAKGNLGLTISAVGAGYDTINFPSSISAGKFMIIVGWRGSVAANCATPTATLTNLVVSNDFCLGTSNVLSAPSGAAGASLRFTYVAVVTVSGYSSTGSLITFSAGTLPATPTFVDIEVIALPLTDNFV